MLCLCPVRRWFFYVNSDPFKLVPQAQVYVRHNEFPRLPNEVSYIDTRGVTVLSGEQVSQGMARNGADVLGVLDGIVRKRVVDQIKLHGLIAPVFADVIFANLT